MWHLPQLLAKQLICRPTPFRYSSVIVWCHPIKMFPDDLGTWRINHSLNPTQLTYKELLSKILVTSRGIEPRLPG